jgi:hypothetical protein
MIEPIFTVDHCHSVMGRDSPVKAVVEREAHLPPRFASGFDTGDSFETSIAHAAFFSSMNKDPFAQIKTASQILNDNKAGRAKGAKSCRKTIVMLKQRPAEATPAKRVNPKELVLSPRYERKFKNNKPE